MSGSTYYEMPVSVLTYNVIITL